jgi:hypothetical protein
MRHKTIDKLACHCVCQGLFWTLQFFAHTPLLPCILGSTSIFLFIWLIWR